MTYDTSERDRLHQELRRREEQYRQIVETAQEGIWTIDADERTTFVNGRMAALLGYEPEEMLGRPLYDFVPTEQVVRAQEHVAERHSHKYGEGDFPLLRKDGTLLWVRYVANPLVDEHGEYVGSLAMVSDITERRAAEEMLRLQKRQLEDAQRIAHIGSWRRGLMSDDVQWSDELYRIFGFEPGTEATLDRLLQVVVEEDVQHLRDAIEASRRGAKVDVEYRIRRADGEIRYLHSLGEVLTTQDGSVEFLGVTQDTTQQVLARREQERLYADVQRLLHSVTQGIFGIDPDGRCTFINRAAAEQLGYRPDEVLGRSMHELVHHHHEDGTPFPKNECAIEFAARTGIPAETYEDVLWRRDGTSLSVEYSASPITEAGEVLGAVVVFTDLTERKALEARIEQLNRLGSLGRLAATITHEFNNVLMGIQPFAEVLARQKGNPQIEQATRYITEGIQRGRRITQEILRFTRPAEPAKETFEFGAWLEHVTPALRAIAGARVSVRVETAGEPLYVHGDRAQLEQVLTNLVANAREAMESAGEVVVTARRALTTDTHNAPIGDAGGYLHVIVEDRGRGIDPTMLKHIFEPFFTTKRSGTGLGLAVVQRTIHAHGGSIYADSTAGRGTQFHVFLPLAEAAHHVEAPASVQKTYSTNVRSVLLVEDDDAIADGLAELLRQDGLTVEVATSGAEALRCVEQHVPDVVILDRGLPDMDGSAVFAAIRSRHPHLAIIVASGHHDVSVLRPHTSDRVWSLAKPYDFDAVLAIFAMI